MPLGNAVAMLLALGWRGAADMPISIGTIIFALVGAILGMFGVSWLGRESVRQREQKFWDDLEDDDQFLRWYH